MKLLQFELEKALSGHPWGTRDGRKGKKIFDTERDLANRLIGVLEDGQFFTYSINGKYNEYDVKDEKDLFLYQETKKGWVVIYRDEHSSFGFQAIRCAVGYDKEKQENFSKANGTYHSTVEVEY